MNIVHVVEPFAGGIVSFLKSLLDTSSNDAHIIVHGQRPAVMSVETAKNQLRGNCNVRFIRWKWAQRKIAPHRDLAAFFELYSILKRLKKKGMLDAVHLHSSKSGFLGRIVCKLLSIKNVVYTPNGAPFMVGETAFSNFLYKQLEKLSAVFGGKTVCCSQSEQKIYNEAGISAICINNGIEIKSHNHQPEPRQETGVFRIVTTGRIINQKNPQLFNQIAAYFEDIPQFEFYWVGDGPDREVLTATNISITAWLDRAESTNWVTNSDLYISTARFEGLSFSVLEALSLKKPLLLTDTIGNTDMINNNLNGALFTNASEAILKIIEFYNNKPMLQTMGEYSGLYCQSEFDIRSTRTKYRRLYCQVEPAGFQPNNLSSYKKISVQKKGITN